VPSGEVSPAAGLRPADPLRALLWHLARWHDANWPDEKRARGTLARLIALHGSPTVVAAFGELTAQMDDGVPVARPVVVLEKVCQRLKATPAKPRVPPWEVEKRRKAEEFNRILRGEAVA